MISGSTIRKLTLAASILLPMLAQGARAPRFDERARAPTTDAPAAAGSATAPISDPTGMALIKAVGRPAPARTAFAEARFMRMLDAPLVVSGELAWLGGDRLERRVDTPRKESFSIAKGEVTQTREGHSPRHFSLTRAPQLQGLLDSFTALLSGDASRLGNAFAIAHSGNPAEHWSLTLTPRDPKVASTVARIRVDGERNTPRCIVMQEADGDVSFDLLGTLAAQMPAAPTRDGLNKLCQGAR